MSESSDQAQFSEAHTFTGSLIPKLQRHPKRIVFTDGADERVLRVAARMVKDEVGIPILLGDREQILSLAREHGIGLDFVKVLEPEKAGDFDVFCEFLKRTEHVRGVEVSNAAEILRQPAYFGAMMIQYGQADGLVGGNLSEPQHRDSLSFGAGEPQGSGAGFRAPGLDLELRGEYGVILRGNPV